MELIYSWKKFFKLGYASDNCIVFLVKSVRYDSWTVLYKNSSTEMLASHTTVPYS